MVLIDIRQEFEIKEKRLITFKDIYTGKIHKVLCIPINMIQYNLEFIYNIASSEKVFLFCNSGRRSAIIKHKLFLEHPNIVSYPGGIQDIIANNPEWVKSARFQFLQYDTTQYTQMIFLMIMAFNFVWMHIYIHKPLMMTYLMYVDLVILFFIFYQISTKSCIITKLLQ